MSKQDIIDYVMETPGNSNRAVLASMLEGLNENVGPISWNELIDKPFGEPSEQLINFLEITYPAGASLLHSTISDWPVGYYRMYVDGVQYPDVYKQYSEQTSVFDLDSYPCFFWSQRTGQYTYSWLMKFEDTSIEHHVKVYKVEHIYTKINEEYIPDTIARTETVASLDNKLTELINTLNNKGILTE